MSNLNFGPIAGQLAGAVFTGLQRAATKDNALSPSAVDSSRPDIEKEVDKAIKDMTAGGGAAVVATKSAWASKINWTQAVGLVATVGALWGIEMDLETQGAVVLGIQGVVAAVTWAMRTFFTKTVTKAAMT